MRLFRLKRFSNSSKCLISIVKLKQVFGKEKDDNRADLC